jgi:replicative DNA helicase
LYILKLFFLPEFHARYSGYVQDKFVQDNNKLLGQLFKAVSVFHEKYPGTALSATDLQVWFLSLYSSVSDTDRGLLAKLCQTLDELVVDPLIAEEYLRSHIERVKATELAILALKVSEGKEPYERLLNAAKDANDATSTGLGLKAVTDELDALIESQVTTAGLRFRLATLRRMLGSLRKGDFGFIFKRPETGGTTLLASEVTFMAPQIPSGSGPVLWINNEEQDRKVLLRCYQAYFGVTQDELVRKRSEYGQKWKKEMGGRIFFPEPSALHRRDVERVCASVNPSLIVIDQLDKVKGFTNDRNDIELTAAYQWARELSKVYAPVLAVSQAGADAEGKKYLEMDHVFGSKTGKQGEADWMLGIGKTHQEGMENVRHFHVVKNKLIQDAEMDPAMRHGKADVLIVPEIGRYKDIGQ